MNSPEPIVGKIITSDYIFNSRVVDSLSPLMDHGVFKLRVWDSDTAYLDTHRPDRVADLDFWIIHAVELTDELLNMIQNSLSLVIIVYFTHYGKTEQPFDGAIPGDETITFGMMNTMAVKPNTKIVYLEDLDRQEAPNELRNILLLHFLTNIRE